MTMRPYCTFRVGQAQFAISAADVTEFGRVTELTPVPLAPRSVAGLINLRGQIVTVIDIRRYFGIDAGRPDEAIGIFFRHEESLCSLLVDSVDDIVDLDEDEFEAPPGNVSAEVREVLLGVCKRPKHLLMIVDPHRAIAAISPEAVPS